MDKLRLTVVFEAYQVSSEGGVPGLGSGSFHFCGRRRSTFPCVTLDAQACKATPIFPVGMYYTKRKKTMKLVYRCLGILR